MMRILVLLSICIFSICSCINQPTEKTNISNDIFENMIEMPADSLAQYFIKKQRGNISQITIKDALDNNQSGFYITFSVQHGKSYNPRLHIQYSQQDVFQFSVNKQKYTYKSNHSKTTGSSKKYWYEYDLRATDMRLIYNLIHTKKSGIIFKDGTTTPITKKQINNIITTLAYFEKLGGKRPSMISMHQE